MDNCDIYRQKVKKCILKDKVDPNLSVIFLAYKNIFDKINVIETELNVFISLFEELLNKKEFNNIKEKIKFSLKNFYKYDNMFSDIENEIYEILKSTIVEKK